MANMTTLDRRLVLEMLGDPDIPEKLSRAEFVQRVLRYRDPGAPMPSALAIAKWMTGRP